MCRSLDEGGRRCPVALTYQAVSNASRKLQRAEAAFTRLGPDAPENKRERVQDRIDTATRELTAARDHHRANLLARRLEEQEERTVPEITDYMRTARTNLIAAVEEAKPRGDSDAEQAYARGMNNYVRVFLQAEGETEEEFDASLLTKIEEYERPGSETDRSENYRKMDEGFIAAADLSGFTVTFDTEPENVEEAPEETEETPTEQPRRRPSINSQLLGDDNDIFADDEDDDYNSRYDEGFGHTYEEEDYPSTDDELDWDELEDDEDDLPEEERNF